MLAWEIASFDLIIEAMKIFSFLIFATLFLACGEEASKGSNNSTQNSFSISLDYNRAGTTGSSTIEVIATLTKSGSNISGASLTGSIDRGTLSSFTDNGDGTYSATLTPDATNNSGEYDLTVSHDSTSIKRTLVIFSDMHASLGQPIGIPGDYVNTEGYEDGVSVTPDGEYLFVQYSPASFTGTSLFNAGLASGGCNGTSSTSGCL